MPSTETVRDFLGGTRVVGDDTADVTFPVRDDLPLSGDRMLAHVRVANYYLDVVFTAVALVREQIGTSLASLSGPLPMREVVMAFPVASPQPSAQQALRRAAMQERARARILRYPDYPETPEEIAERSDLTRALHARQMESMMRHDDDLPPDSV